MDDVSGAGFDDFSVEMGNFEMKKVRKFDRLWKITEGGSIDQHPLFNDGKVYFGSLNHNLYCLNANDGSFIWKFKARDRIGISSPAIHKGIVYIGSYDQNLYAVNAENGQLIWKFFTRGDILATPAVRGDIVYIGSRDKYFYALDAMTGAVRWKFRTMGEILCDVTFHKDRVLFGSYDKNLYCLDAETGAMIWKFRAEQEVVNTGGYAILDDCLYLSSFDNYLRKIDLNTGRELWRKRFGQYGLSCGTLIHGDLLLLPVRDGIMYGLDLDGNVRWKFETTKPLGVPIIHEDRIYFTCEDKNFYCLSLDGKLLWKYKTQGFNWWMPTIWKDRVHFSSYDCHFYALDAKTGADIWRFKSQGSPSTGPPPYEMFELQVTTPSAVVKEETRKEYNAGAMLEGEESGSFYKTRMTYQVSSRYQEKGKYQIDSDEEAF